MSEKRKMRTKIKNLQPAERPDPFKPAKSYYNDHLVTDQDKIAANSCADCVLKGRPFSHLTDWERQKISANWKFSNRVDSHI